MNIPFRFKVNFQIVFLCGLIGLLLLVLGGYMGFIFLPKVVNQKIHETKELREGSQQWDIWVEAPFPFYFKVHLFNVDNHEDVLRGAKPIVTDKGPYVYKLYRRKDQVVRNKTADELSYYEYDIYIFDQEASGKLSDHDLVTVLNVPFLNFLYTAETTPELAGFLSSLNEEVHHIFGEHTGLFLANVMVKDFLFDGLRICKNGCAGEGFLAETVCHMIQDHLPVLTQMRADGKDILYATFHYKNNTSLGYCTVDSGSSERSKTGQLKRINNTDTLAVWHDDEYNCNKIRGITSIFPTNMESNTRFLSFSNEICRSLELAYSGTEIVGDIKGYRYSALKTSLSNTVVENRCYCINKTHNLDGNLGCLYDGVLDLMDCQGNIE